MSNCYDIHSFAIILYTDNATEEDVSSSTSHTVAVPVTIVTAIYNCVIPAYLDGTHSCDCMM